MISFVERFSQIESARREVIVASAFLFTLLIIGTIGYRQLEEGWSLIDGFYMTFITLTTIGFMEVKPLSDNGRLFTMAIGFFGIGAVAFIATRAAQLLLTGQLIRTRQMQNKIAQLQDHYLLCGYGTVGRNIAEELSAAGVKFVVIDHDEDAIQHSKDEGFLSLLGDAEDESMLEQAGIAKAKGLILAIQNDSANVFVSLTARELNPSIFILVRSQTHHNRRKLIRAGADRVVAANEIGASRMSQVILKPHVERFMSEVVRSDGLDLSLKEVVVGRNSVINGKSLAESRFRQQFQTMVIGIVHDDTGEMEFNPEASVILREGDVLIVVGSEDDIRQLQVASNSG